MISFDYLALFPYLPPREVLRVLETVLSILLAIFPINARQ